MARTDRWSSPRFVRRLTMVSALVLVAGVVAFTIAFFGNTADKEPVVVPAAGQASQPESTTPPPPQRAVPLENEARAVAGEFILSAVTRENMAKAWKLTDPKSEIRQCNGRPCTYREWLSGDVPIQPFPAEQLEDATFAINESLPGSVVLEVALLPKDGSKLKGQFFFIGLKKVGNGKKAQWLVTYWAPRAINPVPNSGEGTTH
jgi:hypothetical protein